MKSLSHFVAHLAKVYVTALPRVVYGVAVAPLFNPRQALGFSERVLNNEDLTKPCPILGSLESHKVFPVEEDVIIKGPYHYSNNSGTNRLLELAALAAAVRFIKPKTIFEIGTHVGRTSRMMLLNAGAEATLFTLDMPSDQCSHVPGRDLKNTNEVARTTFLTGDSMRFDFSRWIGQMDLVWIDANHDYPHVKVDTENAFRLVSPGGWILWHDYRHTAWWSGVTRCVRDVKRNHPALFHIMGTTIAALHVDQGHSQTKVKKT